jgi:hypothetical protein
MTTYLTFPNLELVDRPNTNRQERSGSWGVTRIKPNICSA